MSSECLALRRLDKGGNNILGPALPSFHTTQLGAGRGWGDLSGDSGIT